MSGIKFTKTLSAVEARPERSNQHEFNGVSQLKAMLGLASRSLTGEFSLLGSDLTAKAEVTWYDARIAHETRTEHRLYFPTNVVMNHAKEGDLVEFLLEDPALIRITLISR